MGIAYNTSLDSEAVSAHRNHDVTELLKFRTEKIIEIDSVEREKQSLDMIHQKMPKVISVPRSKKRVERKNGEGKWHADYELRRGLEIAEAFLVPTSPRKLD